LGLVGESGSGKSVTALSILQIVPYPGKVIAGEVIFQGRDLLRIQGEELRKVRGKEIALIFQDPMSGLNPVLSIGDQVREMITSHSHISKKEAKQLSLEALRKVGLPDHSSIASRYPFQLSIGQAQRVMIAIAMVHNPKVIIADEPTSSLDTTVQAQILSLLARLQRENGTSIILITHNMGVVAKMADYVAVMYAGAVVEYADTRSLFEGPLHPYTWSLLEAIPRLDAPDRQLLPIKGTPPDAGNLPEECPFLPRCIKALSVCRTSPKPKLEPANDGHFVACYNPVVHDWA
ncbi:MAG: ABC transporter ATP-binding protein, partial [Chloroflexi bacterium]|nr:ABC transporter ATP-binding protein [Chloroflexota bacterium]